MDSALESKDENCDQLLNALRRFDDMDHELEEREETCFFNQEGEAATCETKEAERIRIRLPVLLCCLQSHSAPAAGGGVPAGGVGTN